MMPAMRQGKHMTYSTDERLKGYLDTNQLQRERMCVAVLAIDKRFSNVRPRHPRGGPDRGRDIDATFQGEQKAFGAIGFVNQANDSREHKRKAKKKFADDLKSALNAEPDLKAFVFFTNVNLTAAEKDELVLTAKSKGLAHCEIMDRERMRLVLDGVDGLIIRFQVLDIPMSESEQAAFLARWGDDIQASSPKASGRLRQRSIVSSSCMRCALRWNRCSSGLSLTVNMTGPRSVTSGFSAPWA
jgi:hypothetical protein